MSISTNNQVLESRYETMFQEPGTGRVYKAWTKWFKQPSWYKVGDNLPQYTDKSKKYKQEWRAVTV